MADMDIAPALLEKLRKAFHDNLAADQTGAALLEKIANGGKYPDAMNYAESVGRALAEAFRENLSSADLPDGRMYWNIADRVIRPLLGEDHALIAEQAAAVQQTLNKAAGLGLKAQKAPLDEDRVYGILNRLANEENYDKVAWILQEPVMVFSRSVVDDTLERNVSFQGKSGLSPKIIRTAEYKCCKWCSNLGGVYQYPDVPKDVYRRHENCRCMVEYAPDGVKRQNVHTKRWTNTDERDKIEQRKKLELIKRFPDVVIGKSVGAKSKNYKIRLPDGSDTQLTEGSRVTNVKLIAGLGRNRQIDIVDILCDRYKGTSPDLWKKFKGIGYVDFEGESYMAELHWYEEKTVGRVEWKVKPDADGNWFIDG